MDALLQDLGAHHHIENLGKLQTIAQAAFERRELPDFNAIPPDVWQTAMLTMAVANLVLVMLIAPLRRWTLQTLESIVTVLLLLLLIGVVLGTPIGILYLSYKGLAFVATSLLTNFPQLQQLATNLVQTATTAVGIGKQA